MITTFLIKAARHSVALAYLVTPMTLFAFTVVGTLIYLASIEGFLISVAIIVAEEVIVVRRRWT